MRIEKFTGHSISEATEQMKSRLTHTVNIELPDELPLIEADFVLVEQALLNLLENAIKYSPEGAPIDISVHLSDECLFIDVLDRGPGIPAQDLPHIFEKFYRVRQMPNLGGVGLGLAIARGIFDAHQATLKAIPGERGGMIFRIGFPRLEISVQEHEL